MCSGPRRRHSAFWREACSASRLTERRKGAMFAPQTACPVTPEWAGCSNPRWAASVGSASTTKKGKTDASAARSVAARRSLPGPRWTPVRTPGVGPGLPSHHGPRPKAEKTGEPIVGSPKPSPDLRCQLGLIRTSTSLVLAWSLLPGGQDPHLHKRVFLGLGASSFVLRGVRLAWGEHSGSLAGRNGN